MATLEEKAKVVNEMLKTLGVTLAIKQVVEVVELPKEPEPVIAPQEEKKTLADVLNNPPATPTDGSTSTA